MTAAGPPEKPCHENRHTNPYYLSKEQEAWVGDVASLGEGHTIDHYQGVKLQPSQLMHCQRLALNALGPLPQVYDVLFRQNEQLCRMLERVYEGHW